jgi:two-component system response regulator HydG
VLVEIAAGDPSLRELMAAELKMLGHDVRAAATGRRLLADIRERRADVVVASTQLPDLAGTAIVERIKAEDAACDVILITDAGSYAEAVEAIRLGATDYLKTPVPPDVFQRILQEIDQRRSLQREFATARQTTPMPVDKSAMVGRSEPMLRMFQRLERIAASHASVLIRGESGTGKELVARWIHQRSPRSGEAFVAINCAALPETLIEAELFGHERGAFTGAVRTRRGRFHIAHGGTLFLDEVAEIPLPIQAKLLRVLQEGEIEPLGGNEVIKVDVRVLSATHRDLKARIAAGLFREDLFYRLKVLDAAVPPLRQRRSDLPVLVDHFLRRFSAPNVEHNITPRAWAAIASYDYPGNVRELEHAIQHAVVMAGEDNIDLMHLPTEILGAAEVDEDEVGGFTPLGQAVREFERNYLQRALSLADGNKTRAAQLLGISRKNLWEKLKSLGVES